MLFRLHRFVMPAVPIGLPIALFAFSGYAQDARSCDQVVSDKAEKFTAGQVQRIEEAADKLRSAGADVHVATLTSAAGDNVEPAVDALLESCPSWRGTGAPLRTTLILFAAAPAAHKTEIRFGSRWSSALSDTWRSVMSDAQAIGVLE